MSNPVVSKQAILDLLAANNLKMGAVSPVGQNGRYVYDEGYYVDVNDSRRVVLKYGTTKANGNGRAVQTAALTTASLILRAHGYRIALTTSEFLSIRKGR